MFLNKFLNSFIELLHKWCREFLYTLYPVFPILILYYGSFVNNKSVVMHYLLKAIPYSDSFSFPLISFYFSGIPFGRPHYNHVSLGSSWLRLVILMTLIVLRRTGQIFCSVPLLGFVMFFSCLDWNYVFWEGRPQR